MKIRSIALLTCLLSVMSFAANAEKVGEIELDTPLLSIGGKMIQITAFDDPKVSGVTCHVSDVVKTGLASFMSDDPSNASIACRQTGQIKILGATEDNPWGDLNVTGEDVFGRSKGWFKSLKVTRIVDLERSVLIYVVYTPKWGGDSNKNVISTVSLYGVR